MKVVIRVDASLQIGTGHVMRCLTLAEALKQQGARIEFICCTHEGNLHENIEQQGFKVHKLPQTTKFVDSDDVVETYETLEREKIYGPQWLGSTQQQDAEQCKPILDSIRPDWVIVDHYAIDQIWQALLKESYKALMVIDDLANRKHFCDLLLDQTYGRKTEEYVSFVPQGCRMLLGSQYALLRPEFVQWRKYSLKRRVNPELKKLLITMGGVDPDNITGQVLDALKTCKLPKELEIAVVMGTTAPHIEAIKKLAEVMPYTTEVQINVNNMAEIMANADLAIGAAGATTWERCCLGLPSIQVVIADNQLSSAQNLASEKIVIHVLDVKNIQIDFEKLSKLADKSALVTDGMGVHRVLGKFYGND